MFTLARIFYNYILFNDSTDGQLILYKVLWAQGWLVPEPEQKHRLGMFHKPGTEYNIYYEWRNIIGQKQGHWLVLVLKVKSYSDRLKL